MALKTIYEGVESEEVVSNSDEVCDNVETSVSEEKNGEELMKPWSGPWESSVCEGESDCVMMDAAKVSPQVLKDLCSDKCIIAFVNINEMNENVRNKILDDEIQFEKLAKELKSKLFEKGSEISSLKHESSITKDQLQTMIEKYHSCKKELESTQITCEKWVESCKGYELMLEKQIKTNVKLGIFFGKNDQVSQNIAENNYGSVEIIPTNMAG
ncbi:hypothetical protein Hanom_Chr12g01125391 [Helianthus anomalus]